MIARSAARPRGSLIRVRVGTPRVSTAWASSARSSVKLATRRMPLLMSNVATAARSEKASRRLTKSPAACCARWRPAGSVNDLSKRNRSGAAPRRRGRGRPAPPLSVVSTYRNDTTSARWPSSATRSRSAAGRAPPGRRGPSRTREGDSETPERKTGAAGGRSCSGSASVATRPRPRLRTALFFIRIPPGAPIIEPRTPRPCKGRDRSGSNASHSIWTASSERAVAPVAGSRKRTRSA